LNINRINRIGYYILILVGTLVLIWQGILFKEAQDARSWPTANGKIISSRLSAERDSGFNKPMMYGTSIKYEYSIDGKAFVSNRILFGQMTSNWSNGANTLISRYPPGKVVTVYYNPKNPEIAVLEPGKIGTILFVFIAFFFLIIGLLPLLLSNFEYFRKLNPDF
jgi:hypothetical protein